VNKEALKKFVEDNPKLVKMRPAGDNIFVLKYSKSVFFDDLWNDYLEECRGTVVDADFNVISRPFTKIYNYGIEARAPRIALSTPVTAYRKVNGFMVALTWYNDDILVSTTGSTNSPYVLLANEMMMKEQPWGNWVSAIGMNKGYTFMFECVHPSDPHIIPEDAGMYFLGWRENSWDSQVLGYGKKTADHWRDFALGLLHCKYPEATHTTLGELQAMSKSVKHEGFVFYTEDNISSKIKSPWYLTNKWVARNPRTDKLADLKNDIKKNLDEEYYPLVDAIRANIDEYTAMDEQSRLAWVRNFVGA
jgi:hypothetical protein